MKTQFLEQNKPIFAPLFFALWKKVYQFWFLLNFSVICEKVEKGLSVLVFAPLFLKVDFTQIQQTLTFYIVWNFFDSPLLGRSMFISSYPLLLND